MPDSIRAFSKIGLAPEVFERVVLGGIGDADMDNSLDARFPGGLEEGEGVLHGVGVLEQAVVEPHPVRIVEDRDALQMLSQEPRVVLRSELGGRECTTLSVQ